MHLTSRRSLRALAAAAIAGAAIALPAVALASSGDGQAATPQCTGADTFVWLGLINDGTTGHLNDPVEFTNVSGHACYLFGFPGVSGVNRTLHQLGPAAARISLIHHRVTLQPRQSAHAILSITDRGFIAGCHNATGTGLKVFPPNQKQRQFVVNFTFPACTNKLYLHVYPVAQGIGVP